MREELNSIKDYMSRNELVLSKLNNSIISGFYKNRIVESLNGLNLENKINKRGNNHVFRIGIVDDFSIALRIPTGFNSCGIYSKSEVENYCINANSVFDNLLNVANFCLPVKHLKLDNHGDMCESYALLTEDLTDWGRFRLEDVKGCRSRIIKNKINFDGENCGEIYVDLGPRSYDFMITSEYKFTESNLVLDLR